MRKTLVVSMMFLCAACAESPEKDGWELAEEQGEDVAAEQGSAGSVGGTDARGPMGQAPENESPVSAVECIDGASGSGSIDGNWVCDSTVTCDGVEYLIDCVNEDCSCIVDGELVAQISTEDTCLYAGLRECGAPIPPVNPHCYNDQIWSGGGFGDKGGFCETGTTCNDVSYRLECLDDTGECTCFVDDEPGPPSTATIGDCAVAKEEALRECGAALRPRP